MDVTVTFVGNATTLISAGGVTLLTDPNFLHRGQHAYLGYGLVSRRRHDPAFDIDRLPEVHAVVLSHMHGDHWDRVTQAGLAKSLPVWTTPHAAKRLRRRGFRNAHGMATWDTRTLSRDTTTVTVTALPGQHAPTPVDRVLPPVMGSMIEFAAHGSAPRRVYVSGDTLLVEQLRDIPRRFPTVDAGILHLGGTRLPFGPRLPIGLTVTMDGRQGADATELLALPRVIPVHYDDYGVFASPLSDFLAEMGRRGLDDRVSVVDRGASITL